ncbi:MAG: hypothetical protein QOE90_538, partial [Thermoplasmata archaeon]|nr:hypothetical protein [Thermoplasmata archaeon]
METLVTARPLPGPGSSFETPAATCYHLAPGAAAPPGTEVVVPLPDATRLAYAPRGAGPGLAVEVPLDPRLRGNAFVPIHQSTATLAAALSVAAARRLDTGPESERVLVVLRGLGLVFAQNGDTFRVEPGSFAFAPAGEPLRVWAQGPEDLLAVVLQPVGAAVARRSLAGELA